MSTTTSQPLWGYEAKESAAQLTKDIAGTALAVIQRRLQESSSATVSAISTLHQNHDKIVLALNSRIALLETSITTALKTHTSQVERCLTTSIQERDSTEADIVKIVRGVVLGAISELQQEDSSNLTLQEYVGQVCEQAQQQVKDLSDALDTSTRTVARLEAELAFVKHSTIPVEHLTETSVRLAALESQLSIKALEFERLKEELLESSTMPAITSSPTNYTTAATEADQSDNDDIIEPLQIHAGILDDAIQSCKDLCNNAQHSENLEAENATLRCEAIALKRETLALKKKAAQATEQLEASMRDFEVKERQVSVLSNQLCEAVYQREIHGGTTTSRTPSTSPPPAAATGGSFSIHRPLRRTLLMSPTIGMKSTREGVSTNPSTHVDMTSIERVVESNVKLVEELQANKVVMERMLAAVENNTSATASKKHRFEAHLEEGVAQSSAAVRSRLWNTIRTASGAADLLEEEDELPDCDREEQAAGGEEASTVGGRHGSQGSIAAALLQEEEEEGEEGSDLETETSLENLVLERTVVALGAKVDRMITLSLNATHAWMESLGSSPSGGASSSNGIALEGLRVALGKYAYLCSEQEANIAGYAQEINALRAYAKDLEAKVALKPTTELLVDALRDATQAMRLAADRILSVEGDNSPSNNAEGGESRKSGSNTIKADDSVVMQLNDHLTTITSRETSLIQLLELTAQQSADIRREIHNKEGASTESAVVVSALRQSLEEETARADRFLALYEQYAEEGISWMDQLWTMESRATAVLQELNETKANYVPMAQHTEALTEMNTLISTEKTLRDTIVILEERLKATTEEHSNTSSKCTQLETQMADNNSNHLSSQRNLEQEIRNQQNMNHHISGQLHKYQQDTTLLKQELYEANEQLEQLIGENKQHQARFHCLQERSVIELAKDGLLGDVFPDVSTAFLQSMEEGLFDVVAYRTKIADLEDYLSSTSARLEEVQHLLASESCSRQQVTVDLLSATQRLANIEAETNAKIDSLTIQLATSNRSIILLTRERDEALLREESRKLQVSLLSCDPVSENVRKYGLKVSKDLQSQVEETMDLYSAVLDAKADLERRLATAEAQSAESKQHVEDLEVNVRMLEQNLTEAELKSEGLKANISSAADTIANLTKVAEEIDTIKKSLRISEDGLERANEHANSLKAAYQQLQDQSKRLTAALATRKPESESVHHQVQKQKEEIENLRKQLQQRTNRFVHRQTQQK